MPVMITALDIATGMVLSGFSLSSPRLEAPSKPAKAKNPNTAAFAMDEKLLLSSPKGAMLKPVVTAVLMTTMLDTVRIRPIVVASRTSSIPVLVFASL